MAWIHDSPKEESEFESALEEAIKGDMVDLAALLAQEDFIGTLRRGTNQRLQSFLLHPKRLVHCAELLANPDLAADIPFEMDVFLPFTMDQEAFSDAVRVAISASAVLTFENPSLPSLIRSNMAIFRPIWAYFTSPSPLIIHEKWTDNVLKVVKFWLISKESDMIRASFSSDPNGQSDRGFLSALLSRIGLSAAAQLLLDLITSNVPSLRELFLQQEVIASLITALDSPKPLDREGAQTILSALILTLTDDSFHRDDSSLPPLEPSVSLELLKPQKIELLITVALRSLDPKSSSKPTPHALQVLNALIERLLLLPNVPVSFDPFLALIKPTLSALSSLRSQPPPRKRTGSVIAALETLTTFLRLKAPQDVASPQQPPKDLESGLSLPSKLSDQAASIVQTQNRLFETFKSLDVLSLLADGLFDASLPSLFQLSLFNLVDATIKYFPASALAPLLDSSRLYEVLNKTLKADDCRPGPKCPHSGFALSLVSILEALKEKDEAYRAAITKHSGPSLNLPRYSFDVFSDPDWPAYVPEASSSSSSSPISLEKLAFPPNVELPQLFTHPFVDFNVIDSAPIASYPHFEAV